MISDFLGIMIRLILLIAAVATGVAIRLGHAGSEAPPPPRVAAPPSYQVLDLAITAYHGEETIRLDVETGQLDTLPLPPGLRIDEASLAPWVRNGRRQLVGVGWDRSASGGARRYSDLGLIRMSLPDGEILDRLTLSDISLPISPPCWIPGTPASVLYVGGDNRLYRVDFEPPGPDWGIGDAADPHPRRLEWRASMPGAGELQFWDLTWPEEPRLGGRAIASLRFKEPETGRYTDCQIWWLQFDPGGTSIIAAGPLLEPSAADTNTDAAVSRRMPNLVGPPGEPALAYLWNRPGESRSQLRVAPLQVDSVSGRPLARESNARTLARDCRLTRPIASADGQWITVVRTDGPRLSSERIAVAW